MLCSPFYLGYHNQMRYGIVLLLLFPSLVFAHPVINEIAWMGTLVQGVDAGQEWRYEWIELFNSGESVLLDGWTIELAREEVEFVIPLSGTLLANEYLVMGASDKIEGVDVSYNNLAGKFVNGGMRIVLRDTNGNIVDELDQREGWFAGSNRDKKTMERRDVSKGVGDEKNWGTSLLVIGTPGAENTLYGTYGSEDVVLEGFQGDKKDLDGVSFNFPLYATASLTALASLLAVGVLRRRLRFPW